MAKKKILYVVEAMGGGVFTYLVDLSNRLADDFDITIAYAVRPQTPADFRDYFDQRIHLIEVKNFTRSIRPEKDVKAVLEVRKIAAQVQPDLIHLHSSKAGVVGRIAFSGRKVPLFYTPHGYSFLMQNVQSGKRAVFRKIEAAMARRNCTTISCSYGEHQETLKLTKRALYAYNGVDTEELGRLISAVSGTDHPFTVFTIGRICDQKNPALFDQIAASLPEVRFLWIGDGELRDELKSPNIRVTGWVDRASAISIGMNADVFLLTSLWEGLPISLLEAMYMKKLCVVSDVIGNHDVIRNGENGFVCRTAEEFRQAILTRDTDRLTEKAYQEILDQYNTAVMAEKYKKIYTDAIYASEGLS